jgi:vitamin B12 transporter
VTYGNHTLEDRSLLSARYLLPAGQTVALAFQLEGRSEGLDTTTVNPSATYRQRDLAGSARTELRLQAGPHHLLFGLSGGAERLEGAGLGGARARGEAAAWLADEWLLFGGRLRIAPSFRAEQIGRFGGLSGKLGIAAPIVGPLSARASAGESWRAPSFFELYFQQGAILPNPDLVPEQAFSADAALRLDGRAGFASLGLFSSLYDQLIVYLPGGPDRQLKPFNLGRAWARGLEAEAATAPLGPLGFTGQLAWTWMRDQSVRDSLNHSGMDVPHVARQRIYARLGVAPGRWELHGEAHYVGRQFDNQQEIDALPAALLFHAGGSIRLWRHPSVRLDLEVKNLADDRTLTTRFGYPLPGRMVLLSLLVDSRSNGYKGDER